MTAPRKNVTDYVKPERSVRREELARLDATGDYVCDEKLDGVWCRVKLDSSGSIVDMRSRTDRVSNSFRASSLIGLQTAVRAPAILVGELVTDRILRGHGIGRRRLHLFDVIEFNGTNCRSMNIVDRRTFLVCIQAAMGQDDCIKLTEQRDADFIAFFDEIVKRGGEGVVLKRRRSKYYTSNATGKISGWVRCKPTFTVNYVVRDTGKAKGGVPNLSLGLSKGRVLYGPNYNKLSIAHVMNATIPRHLRDVDPKTLVGRIVEVEGYRVLPSGAVSHGQINCVRDDKLVKDCTFDAACNADPRIASGYVAATRFLDGFVER